MRTEMREQHKHQEMKERISQRNDYADRLFEKWAGTPGIGQNMEEAYNDSEIGKSKMRNLSIVLENQENHMGQLTETQLSNAFSTTPENVIRVVRLGYPNSVRGELFLEWAMETARDSIYYLSPKYVKTKRGATAGNITHESDSYRYASEIEMESLGTGDDSTVEFTGTLDNVPATPYTVAIYVDNKAIATDDGSGNLIGADLDTGSAAVNTVDYTTGEITVTFDTAPGNDESVQVSYHFDSEDPDQYEDIQEIQLQLRDYQFRVRPWPLYVSWSKMTELLLNTTLNIDAEDALIRGAADEFKKSLDFHAIRYAYRYAKKNGLTTYDKEGAVGESEFDRARAFSRAIDEASDAMLDDINRGGITKIVSGPNALSFVKLHPRFDASTRQPRVGAYREGSLDGIDTYKVPSSVIPNNQMLGIYRNEEVPEDVSIAFGSLIPLYRTQTLEFKEMYSETGLAYFGDQRCLQPSYLRLIQIDNL